MDVVYFPDQRSPGWRQPIVALGNFDGLHRGHMKIVERVCRQARERQSSAVVMTFDPHPPRVVRPDKAPPLLMTLPQRLAALEQAGIDGVAVVRFTEELSKWEPEAFVSTVLVNWVRASEIWVGGNFLFGRNRSGTFSLLRQLGARYGFRVEKIDPVRYKEFVVSSTRIRRLVSEGRVDEAGALLGRLYSIEGHVVRGAARGRELGFPTANLATRNELLPADGVYATTLTHNGTIHASVSNIGVRPTFGDEVERVVEAHVLDATLDLYGAEVRLAFVQRMRPERAFESRDALVAQIGADCDQARRLFDRISL